MKVTVDDGVGLETRVVGPVEAPGLPGATTRRFEAFERNPEREAPLA